LRRFKTDTAIFLHDDGMFAHLPREAPLASHVEPTPPIHVSTTSKFGLKATRSARYPGAIRPSSDSIPRNAAGVREAMTRASTREISRSATALRTASIMVR